MAYSDEQDDEELDAEEMAVSPLGALRDNTTSDDAKQAASKMLDSLYNERESTKGEEKSALHDYENQAAQAREVLKNARLRLQVKQHDRKLEYLRQSAAWLKPTRSGRFAESAGNATQAEADNRAEELAQNEDNQRAMLGLEQGEGAINSALIAQRLKSIQSRRAQQDRLTNTALTVLGKSTKGSGRSGVSMSKYGKQARDEGLTEDTPEFTARVQELYNADMHMRRVTSGTDVAPPPPGQPNANPSNVYDMLGVPPAMTDPFAQLSTKDRQDQRQAAQKSGQAQLDKLRPYLDENLQAITSAKRFQELNEKVNTSGALGVARNMHLNLPYLGDVGQMAGQVIDKVTGLSPEATEMDKLQIDLGRAKRMPGERFTNFDQQMLMNSVMGRDKPYQTNKNLSKAMIAAKQLSSDHIQFLNDYLQANHHLEGAENAWHEYVESNPIFDPNKSKLPDQKGNTAAVELNPTRVDYRTYFRRKSKATKAPVPGTSSEVKLAKGGLAKEALQGASLGFADDLSADPDAARAELEETSNDSPLGTLAAQGAGAGATALAARAALRRLTRGKGKGKIGNISATLRAIAERNPVKSQMVTGATVGGLSAIGASDEGMDAPVAGGALVGGAMAPALALATKGGRRAVRRMLPGAMKVSKGERRVIEALPDDAQTLLNNDRRVRVPTALVDVPNPKVEQLAHDTLRHPGEDTGRLGDALQARQAGSRGRVEEAVNRALKPDEYFAKEDDLTEAMYNNARPLYKAAYDEAPVVNSGAFKRLEQLPEGQEAIKYAQKRMQLDLSKEGLTKAALPGEQIAQARSQEELDRVAHSLNLFGADAPNDLKMAYVNKRGTIPAKSPKGAAEVTGPSLEFLDYVKKGMDSQIERAYRAGDNNLARLIRDHRDSLKDELDTASPTYKTARAQYAGDMEVRNALRLGREEIDTLTPQEFINKTQGMSFSEKDALRSGVAQRLFERINNPTADVNYAERLAGSPAMMDKYAAVFDKPSEFEAFKGTLAREAQVYDATAKMLQAARKGSGKLSEDPSSNVLFQSIHRIFARPGGMSDDTANDVAYILQKSGPNAAKQLRQLAEKGAYVARQDAADAAAGTAGAAAAGAMSMPNPRGHMEQDQAPDDPDPYPGRTPEERQPYAGGGEVKSDHKTSLHKLRQAANFWAQSIPGFSPEGAESLAKKPAYVASGILQNLGYGVDDDGNLVSLGEMLQGNDKADLGVVEAMKALPTFAPALLGAGASGLDALQASKEKAGTAEPIGNFLRRVMAKGLHSASDFTQEHMPDWAANAPAKSAQIREKVMQELELGEPETVGDEIADVGGQMLGQLPLPGKKAEVAGTIARSALDKLKRAITAVPEYIGPTINPTKANYVTGTAGGVALGHLPDAIDYFSDREPTESEQAADAALAHRYVTKGSTMPRTRGMMEPNFAKGGKVGALRSLSAALDNWKANKLPQQGFFSTLDELIETSPEEVMPAYMWQKYLQPGKMLKRENLEFPLKKEEIEYAKIPQLHESLFPDYPHEIQGLENYGPDTRLTRAQVQDYARRHRPDIRTDLGIATKKLENMSQWEDSQFAQMRGLRGHKEGEIPYLGEAKYDQEGLRHEPGVPDSYEESMTSSPDVGDFKSHYSPKNISWSRTTRHPIPPKIPLKPEIEGDYSSYMGQPPTMRLVEEIQSDRHSAAGEKAYNPTPEEATEISQLADRLAYQPPGGLDPKIIRAQMDALKEKAVRRRGYRRPGDENLMSKWEGPIRRNDENFDARTTRSQLYEAARNRVPDAPFKDPRDHATLELRKQLLNAVNENDRFLGIVRGSDQVKRYEQGMDTQRSSGMNQMYDQVYPSALRKIAQRYGSDVHDVSVPVMQQEHMRPPTFADYEIETAGDIYPLLENLAAGGEGGWSNDAEDFVGGLLRDYKTLPIVSGPSTAASKAVSRVERNLASIRDFSSQASTAVDEDYDELLGAVRERSDDVARDLERLHEYWVDHHTGQGDDVRVNKSFPAMELTPEVRDLVRRVGVPLFSLTGAVGLGAMGAGDGEDAH